MTATPEGTPPDGTRLDEVARATAGAITGAVIEILRALREEVERLESGAEAFVGRLQGALVRSLDALRRGLVSSALAVLFLALGALVLAVFLVAALNVALGDPWGTGLAALLLLMAGGLFALRARASFRAMRREAETLSGRRE